jgi:hypothetical protein
MRRRPTARRGPTATTWSSNCKRRARDPALTRNTWSYHYIWDLGAYRGQTVDLSFKAFADATNASWFYIDDVAMLSGLVLMPNLVLC